MVNDSINVDLNINPGNSNTVLINFNNTINNTTNNTTSQLGRMNTAFLSFGAAFGTVALTFNKAIERSIEQQRANRLLASSATEAGIAFDVLAEKNRNLAKSFGLSDVAAATVTAKIQQLANATGNSSQFDVLAKRFADLAAAKGIDSAELSTLVGTILSGQDEGLNRLGIADPGQLYKAYAKEVGKSAETLTQFEKVQAAVNAVMEKGAIFDGTAETRMNSLEGQTAKAKATLENFLDASASGVTGNIAFQNSITFINQALQTMSLNIDDVRRKLREGWTPENIANEQLNGFGNQALTYATSFGSMLFGTPLLSYDILTGNENALDNYFGGFMPQNIQDRWAQQMVDQIKAQQKSDEKQSQDAKNQASQNQIKTLSSDFQSRIDGFLNPAKDGLRKARMNLNDLKKIQTEFNKTLGDFGNFQSFNNSGGVNFAASINNVIANSASANAKKKIQDNINEAARAFHDQDARYNIGKFLENPDREGAKKNLEALKSIKDFLPEDTFDELSAKLNKFLKEDLEKAIKKIDEYGKTIRSILDDSFIRSASDNPIAKTFFEGEKAVSSLQEKMRELPDELKKIGQVALDTQNKLNAKNLYSARLDNQLSIFDLRRDAQNFRDPLDPEKQRLDEETFIKQFLFRNPNYLFLKRKEYEQKLFLSNGASGFLSFDEEVRRDILKRGENVLDSPRLRLNNALEEKFNLLFGNPFLSPEQKAINEQKFLAATAGVNPLDLNADLSEKAAQVRESEALRKAQYEKEDLELRKEELRIRKETNKILGELNQKAERGEINSKQIVEIVDRSAGGANILGASPQPSDMDQTYNLGFFGGSNR